MKIRKKLTAIGVTFAVVFGLLSAAQAWYVVDAGIWYRTDQDVNPLALTIHCTKGIELWMYKEGTTPTAQSDFLIFDVPANTVEGVTIQFKQEGNDWLAFRASDSQTTFNLGTNLRFGLYFLDSPDEPNQGATEYADITRISGTTSSYKISDIGPEPCAYVILVDAAPVPIPGAAWLLGSGLFALVGLRKRSQG